MDEKAHLHSLSAWQKKKRLDTPEWIGPFVLLTEAQLRWLQQASTEVRHLWFEAQRVTLA